MTNEQTCTVRSFSNVEEAFGVFEKMRRKVSAFGFAQSMIYLDSVTCAPSDTAEGRGKTLTVLSGMQYELLTDPDVKDAVAYLMKNLDKLDAKQRREISEFDRDNRFTASIPQEEYEEYTLLINDAGAVWHKAKNENDFASFAPYLEKIFDANRRFAGYYKPDHPVYDVLLDRYERGLTTQQCDEFFSKLRSEIVPLLEKVMQAEPVDDSFLHKHYPIEKQRELSDYLMSVLSIDRSHCGIAESEHPFTLNFNKNDVRITTHYHEEDVASSMYSVIHEGGHALYELHIGDEYQDTMLAGGVSMGIHESQSRLFENLIGRSQPFIELIFPKLKELFPEQLEGVDAYAFFRAVNKVQPSLIRTEADELTYALHVMVRYELERDVLEGRTKVAELPAAWAEKMREYLGVEVPDDRRGVLQDSHWSGGSVGYFPSYALGSAYGAQMIARMSRDIDVDRAIAENRIDVIVEWLTEHIFRHGCMYDPDKLFLNCCEQPFDPSYYIEYLKEKFTRIYSL